MEGLHIVQHTLVNNPKERLTISEILAHPYFYDVKPLLPPNLSDYARRQEGADIHRPISSQSVMSAVYPVVPRLNGAAFSPTAISPLNDIRSDIKSS